MVLYAASDRMWVGVSADPHGGCGTPGGHGRPVENGAPVKLWALDCPPCENHLRHDPGWSATLAEIPETYDETKGREDFDKRGANDIQTMLAIALTRITGGELPDTVKGMISGAKPHLMLQGKIVCSEGHETAAGSKFCGECGERLEARASRAIASPQAPPSEPQHGGQDGELDLVALHVKTLARMCREKGLDDTGGKTELIARLAEAEAVPSGV